MKTNITLFRCKPTWSRICYKPIASITYFRIFTCYVYIKI